ncbi:MAG: peptidase, partial [Rhodoferax sp.]|nr:peptidase [Rhodoferax sp.]
MTTASAPATSAGDAAVIDAMRRWLERAVIGLNLCPFAKAVHVKGQVHYAVSHAASAEGVREALADELDALMATDPAERDTAMLMLPALFAEFLDFNDFLAEADNLLADKGLEGIVQIASFHPQFQFGGTAAADITPYTNRAPDPTLHLLREASVERAVEAFPEAEAIFEHNMQTLEKLGLAGWQALDVGPAP